MGYILFISFLIVFIIISRYRERAIFFRKNEQLLDLLSNVPQTNRFENIWCNISKIKAFPHYFPAKMFFIEQALVIVEDYTFDLNKNSRLYANTYVITKPNNILTIPSNLFRNYVLIKEIVVSDKGEINMKTESYPQSFIRKIGFYPISNSLNINFKLSNDKIKTEGLLKDCNIL